LLQPDQQFLWPRIDHAFLMQLEERRLAGQIGLKCLVKATQPFERITAQRVQTRPGIIHGQLLFAQYLKRFVILALLQRGLRQRPVSRRGGGINAQRLVRQLAGLAQIAQPGVYGCKGGEKQRVLWFKPEGLTIVIASVRDRSTALKRAPAFIPARGVSRIDPDRRVKAVDRELQSALLAQNHSKSDEQRRVFRVALQRCAQQLFCLLQIAFLFPQPGGEIEQDRLLPTGLQRLFSDPCGGDGVIAIKCGINFRKILCHQPAIHGPKAICTPLAPIGRALATGDCLAPV
jgi:hypothetical protein